MPKIYLLSKFKNFTIIKQKTAKKRWNFFYATFLALSLFLITSSSLKVVWIICALILTLILITAYWCLLLSLIIFILAYSINYLSFPISLNHYIYNNFQVINILPQGPIILVDGNKVLVKTFLLFNIGDIIEVKGVINQAQNMHDFDWVTYLYAQNINNLILKPGISLIEKHHSFYIFCKNYLQSHALSSWIFLATKIKDGKPIYDLMTQLNLVHMFVISGFHISSIFWIIKKACQKICINFATSLLLSLMIIWLIAYWLNFNVSVLRGSLSVTCNVINKLFFKKPLNRVNSWCLVLIIMFVIWPYQVFSWSFILSFLASFTIILSGEINNFIQQNYHLRQWQTQIIKYFLPLIVVYLVTLPVTIYLNNYWNLLGFVSGLILSPLIIIYQVFTLILLPFDQILNFLDSVLVNICHGFNYLSLIIKIPPFNGVNLVIIYHFIFDSIIIIKQWNLFTDQNLIY